MLSFPNNKLQKTIICSAAPKSDALVIDPGTSGSGSAPSRINSLSQVSGVLGCQWGDEGKGKLVDILANSDHFDVVARCQVCMFESCFISCVFLSWVLLDFGNWISFLRAVTKVVISIFFFFPIIVNRLVCLN